MRTREKQIILLLSLLAPFCVSKIVSAGQPSLPQSFCRALIAHTADADVAYRAGVDSHGKAVVSADLPSQKTIKLPETYDLPLSMDVFKATGLHQSIFPFNAMNQNDINLGTLSLKGEQLFYNEQPLSETQQEQLARLCPTEKPQ